MIEDTARTDSLKRRLIWGLILNAVIIGAEFIGGILTRSVGLMSDATHNLVDQGSLFLTLYAHLVGRRPATARSTFGFHRAGIIAALMNSTALLVVALGLVIMAGFRLIHPVPVVGQSIIWIALLGFVANMAVALLLRADIEGDLNIRGAFWHMLGDAWVSLGVSASGAIMYFTGWYVLDPIITFIVVAAIVKGGWPIFMESLEVLMERAPVGIDTGLIAKTIDNIEGVEKTHDVHVWAVKPGLLAMSCHVLVRDTEPAPLELLPVVRRVVKKQLGIQHLAIQIEKDCCHPDVVHCDLEKLISQHSKAPSEH